MLHNDIPSHGEIAALAEVEGPTCITIVTPTEDAPQDYDKARIAFKDQVRSALASVDVAERKQFEAEYAELDDDDDFALPVALIGHVRDAGASGDLPPPQPSAGARNGQRSVSSQATAPFGDVPPDGVCSRSGRGFGAPDRDRCRWQPADEVRVQGMPKNAADHAGKSSINSRTKAGRLSGSDSRKLRVNQYARAVDHEVRGVLAGRDVPLILGRCGTHRVGVSLREFVPPPGPQNRRGKPRSLVDAGSGGRFASGARRLPCRAAGGGAGHLQCAHGTRSHSDGRRRRGNSRDATDRSTPFSST